MKKVLGTIAVVIGVVIFEPAILAQRTKPAPQSKPAISGTSKTESSESQTATIREATINLKSGSPVSGRFIGADADIIHIEVANNVLKIRVDEVVSVIFAPELVTSNNAPSNRQTQVKEDASRALRALRTLAGAAQVGINFQEYGKRVIDVKNEVDDASSRIPEGELRSELSGAMEAYVDAAQAWNKMLRYDFMLPNAEPGVTLMRKYSLQPQELVPGNRSTLALPRAYVISSIWTAARTHIERAATLVGTPSNE